MPRPFDVNDAMEHWYGRYDPATRTARANLPEHPTIDLAGSFFAPSDPVDIVAIFDAGYIDGSNHASDQVFAAIGACEAAPGSSAP